MIETHGATDVREVEIGRLRYEDECQGRRCLAFSEIKAGQRVGGWPATQLEVNVQIREKHQYGDRLAVPGSAGLRSWKIGRGEDGWFAGGRQ